MWCQAGCPGGVRADTIVLTAGHEEQKGLPFSGIVNPLGYRPEKGYGISTVRDVLKVVSVVETARQESLTADLRWPGARTLSMAPTVNVISSMARDGAGFGLRTMS